MDRSNPAVHALAGVLGGTIAFTITYPLITISTRMQVDKDNKNTTTDIIKKTLREEGWQGFFSGISSGIVGITATSGVYYYCYESLRLFLEGPEKAKISDLKSLSMGALSGMITALMTNPIWVINTRKTTVARKAGSTEDSASLYQTAQTIIQQEGVGALWNGIVPALILAANPTIQYAVFEKLKQLYAKNGKSLTMLQAFYMGAIAKVAATLVTYPYIVVKSRLQNAKKGEEKKNTTSVLSDIFKSEGLSGFYKGIESKITQSVLNAAFLFMFKEEMVSVVIVISRLLQMTFTKSKLTKVKSAAAIASEVVRK